VLPIPLDSLAGSDKLGSDTEAEKIVVMKSGEGWRSILQSENLTTDVQ